MILTVVAANVGAVSACAVWWIFWQHSLLREKREQIETLRATLKEARAGAKRSDQEDTPAHTEERVEAVPA